MPNDISSSGVGAYAIIRWRGEITPQAIEASGLEAIERAAAEDIRRILVDVSAITNRLGATDLFLTTEAHSRLGPPRPRTALLGRPDQAEDLRFIEDVGVNRGMPLKAFTAKEDALNWLLT